MDQIRIQHLFHALEVLGLIVPSFNLTVICTALSTRCVNWPYDVLKNLCIDYIILVVPIVVYCTILHNYLITVNIVLMILATIAIFYIRTNNTGHLHSEVHHHTSPSKQKQGAYLLKYITNTRSIINLITVIAILAVDFSIFPARYHKTARYGFSLMDVGVGLYVHGNGIVACEIRGTKHSLMKTLVNVLPILIVGLLRFLTTYLTHYHVNPHEYGVHWNFFITLGMTKLTSALLMTLITPSFKSCLLISIITISLHQCLLSFGVEDWVFADVARDNLFTANREGIVSCLGYVGLYFMSVATGFVLHLNKKRRRVFWFLLVGILLLTLATVALHEFFNISRCLANSTYILWIQLIAYIMTFLLFCYESFLNTTFTNQHTVVYCPRMFEGINYNGLVYFLVANLLTGAINLSIKTAKVDTEMSLTIILLYMLFNSILTAILYAKNIKMKL